MLSDLDFHPTRIKCCTVFNPSTVLNYMASVLVCSILMLKKLSSSYKILMQITPTNRVNVNYLNFHNLSVLEEQVPPSPKVSYKET